MNSLRNRWNALIWWHKTGIILGCLLTVYTLFGFLLLPRIISWVLEDKVAPTLHRTILVDQVRCNPFTLTTDIDGFHLRQKDSDADFVAFDNLHLNLEMSSLFRLAIVVRDIKLDGPSVNITIDPDGRPNFADLTATNATETAATEKEKSFIVPFIIEPFAIGNGTIVLDDQIKHVTHTIDRIDFLVPHISSRKKDWETYTRPTLAFRVNGAPFRLQGETIPFHNSLKTDFRLDMVDLALPKYWAYVPAREDLQLARGSLTLDTKFVFQQHEDQLPTFSFQGTIIGRDIELTDNGRPVFSAAHTKVVMDDISVLRMKVGLGTVSLQQPFIEIVREKSGGLNWTRYFTPPAGTAVAAVSTQATTAANATNATNATVVATLPAATTGDVNGSTMLNATVAGPANSNGTDTGNATAAAEPPASLLLLAPEIRITEGHVVFKDMTTPKPFAKDIHDLNLTVTNLSTAANATGQVRITAGTGNAEALDVQGTFGLTPVQVSLRVKGTGLNIPTYGPYFQQALPLTLNSALLDANLGLALDGPDAAPRVENSTVTVHDLELTGTGKADGVRLKTISLGGIAADLGTRSVRTGMLTVDGLTIATGRNRKGYSTLLSGLSTEAAPAASTAAKKSTAPAPAWSVTSAGVTIQNTVLQVSGDKEDKPLRLTSLTVGPVTVDTGKQSATVDSIGLALDVDVVRDKDGSINLATLFSAPASGTKNKPAAEKSKSAWNATIKKFELADTAVAFADRSLTRPMNLTVDQIVFSSSDLSLDLTRSIPLNLSCRIDKSGTITASGSLAPQTAITSGKATLSKIPVSPAAAYAAEAANIDIPSGALSGTLSWNMGGKRGDKLEGNLDLARLRITEGRTKTEIAGLTSLKVGNLSVNLDPLHVAIKKVDIVEPRGAFLVDAKGRTTLDRIQTAGSKPAAKKSAPQKKEQAISIDIAAVSLTKGRFSFTDKTLSPQFSSVISPVDLTVTDFSLDPAKRMQLDLSAVIDGTAPLTATGWISPLKSPVEANSTVSLKNLDLVALSPYSSKFIAYPITRGQLDWSMNVLSNTAKLNMGNAINARQLTLGDKVESPDAVDAPVKLGLALLRDMRGDIAINLPVRGDMNDPKFSIGGIVMQAFIGLIVKAVTSPFALLGSLVPDGTDMSRIPFQAGLVTPAPDGLSALTSLADVLAQRPGIKIVITGHADPVADRKAMEEAQFLHKLQVAKYEDLSRKERSQTKPEELEISAEEYPDVLWAAYKEEPVDKEANFLGITTEVPQDLQEAKLRELIKVTDEDLVRLAASRAEYVKTWLVQEKGADAGRIFLGQTGPAALSGKHEVTLEIRP